jgi:arabinose-5-phosphate isomerase
MRDLEIARRVIDIELAAVQRLRDRLGSSFSDAVDLIEQTKGRLIISGLGKSGAIGRKMAATFASTGTPAYFLHATEGLHGDLGLVHQHDTVIGISKSGNTAEVNQLLPVFKRLGVRIIAMTGNPNSRLATSSDVVLDVSVAEEACPHDLAPTASTTVALVLGDALAIALLERRNFTPEDFAVLHPAGSLGKKLLWQVDDIMERDHRLGRLQKDDIMRTAVLEMADKRGICVVVDAANKLLGVLTTGDLNRLLKESEQFFELPVVNVMNTEPKSIVSGTLASQALMEMEKYQIIALPVVSKVGEVLGIVHLHDLLDAGVY